MSKLNKPKKTTQEESQSGKVPVGDKRLTANIGADLHKKLKLAAYHQDTTMGEIVERLVNEYVENYK